MKFNSCKELDLFNLLLDTKVNVKMQTLDVELLLNDDMSYVYLWVSV